MSKIMVLRLLGAIPMRYTEAKIVRRISDLRTPKPLDEVRKKEG